MSLRPKFLAKVLERGNHQEMMYYIVRHEYNIDGCQKCKGKKLEDRCEECKTMAEQRRIIADKGIELFSKERKRPEENPQGLAESDLT